MIGETDEGWWSGTEPADIDEYLDEYTANGYRMTAFRLLHCDCNDQRFSLERTGSLTRRTCVNCGAVRYITRGGGGNAEDWEVGIEETGEPEEWDCPGCGTRAMNVGVGFADYAGHPGFRDRPDAPLPDAILWFYVGIRCAKCGLLVCFNDGKVGWGPPQEVYDRVPG